MATSKRAKRARTMAKPLHKKRSLALQKQLTRKYKTGPVSKKEIYVPPIQEPMSYEEVVIRNIVNNSKGNNVADEAYALTSTLSSLSASLKELQYRKGVAIGKLLYKVKSSTKNYMFPEESVADLVGFFQSAGHKHVTYAAYPENIHIKMHDKRGPNVGASLHTFEAGIISGFLSSALKHYVDIKERSCINDDGPYCMFTVGRGEERLHRGASPAALDQLANHIAYSVRFTKSRRAIMKNGYYMLESALLFDDAYTESIKSLASYVGRNVGEKLSHGGKPKLSEIKYAIRLLNFGRPEIVEASPLHMRLSFDGASSKKEFVDISVAFINGFLSNKIDNRTTAEAHTEKGSYIVDIKEKANSSS